MLPLLPLSALSSARSSKTDSPSPSPSPSSSSSTSTSSTSTSSTSSTSSSSSSSSSSNIARDVLGDPRHEKSNLVAQILLLVLWEGRRQVGG